MFENLASIVTTCTRQCVQSYDQMYLEPEEENCVKKCYAKSFNFQGNLNQELNFLVRNLWDLISKPAQPADTVYVIVCETLNFFDLNAINWILNRFFSPKKWPIN